MFRDSSAYWGGGIDLIATDPPYGIDFLSNRPKDGKEKDKILNDDFESWIEFLPKMLWQFNNALKDGGVLCCCCGGGGTPSLAYLWIEAGKIMNVENVLVWDKKFFGMGWRYRFQWEAIVLASKGERKTWNGGNSKSNVLSFTKVIPQEGDHPTEKPTALFYNLIADNCNQEDLICDPFLGSGTTLVACKELNRKGIGIEISEKYCEIAKKRLQNTTKSLF